MNITRDRGDDADGGFFDAESAAANDLAPVRYTGIVDYWNSDRGFGFIRSCDPPLPGYERVFCHISQIVDGNDLEEDDRVEFEIFVNNYGGMKKVNATKVKVIA